MFYQNAKHQESKKETVKHMSKMCPFLIAVIVDCLPKKTLG